MNISEEERFHFRLIPAEQIRGGIVCFLFILLIPALVTLASPIMSPYFYAACAIWAVMLIWGIGLGSNPYRSEVAFVLFMGVFGLALAFTCQIAVLKMMYDLAGLTGIGYGASSLGGMVLLFGVFYTLHFRTLQKGAYQSMERKGGVGKAGRVALLCAGIGHAAYYIAVAVIGDLGSFVMGMAAFTVLLVLGIYMAVVFIHRYLFIRQHMDKLKAHYPVLGMPKEQRTAAHLTKMNGGSGQQPAHRTRKKRRGSR